MRFIITFITSFLLLIPASGQGEWKIVELEFETDSMYQARQENRLFDVQYINRNIGFLVGNIGSFHGGLGVSYKTEDGGRTWNRIYEDSSPFLNVQFVNKSKGYITCKWGPFLTSSDGGYSWSEDHNIGESEAIFFLNDSIGWACGREDINYQLIFKTIDGGENWNEDSKFVSGKTIPLFFIDEESGWAVGRQGSIRKYSLIDGWKYLPSGTDLPLNKVFFVDRYNGWISGGYTSDDGLNPIFMRTGDGGENWDQNTEMNYLINDFYFENKDHGWAVGEDRAERGVILETYNGGVDWDVVTDTLPARLRALNFYDGVGWAVGDSGLILTNDPTYTGIKKDDRINNSKEPIFQNYPNPFHIRTTISYQLPAISDVELSVYDLSGRKVSTLVNKKQIADRYEVVWSAEGMEASIYFCELKTGEGRQVMKMILVGQ